MPRYDPSKDYYRVLGVSEGATKKEVDKAYRDQARKRHPDRGGTEDEMKSLNEARAILSDPATRKAYDEERKPRPAVYGSSMAFNPDAASKAGTFSVSGSEEDFAGLCVGAATCFALCVPLLILVQWQWMFFLWPLRLLSFGGIGLGFFMAHSALVVKHRSLKKQNPGYPRARLLAHHLIFWFFAFALIGILVTALFFA